MTKPTVDILIEGFADENSLNLSGTARYRPTITLIKVDDYLIIVDPGTVRNQGDIARELAVRGHRTADITHVIHTHHHLDHTRNTGMFPDIPVIDGWAIWDGVDFNTTIPNLPTEIVIEKTPGHTYDSLTVFVKTVDGRVAICGDVFWWEGDTQSDIYAEDISVLRKTREHVLKNAEIIIPGHGPLFRVVK